MYIPLYGLAPMFVLRIQDVQVMSDMTNNFPDQYRVKYLNILLDQVEISNTNFICGHMEDQIHSTITITNSNLTKSLKPLVTPTNLELLHIFTFF